MAHVPMDDIEQIWNGIPSKSWDAMESYLINAKGKPEGISDTLVNMMLDFIPDWQDQPFPESPVELYNFVNDRLRMAA
ncbi:MAG: hypothetical protein C4521_13180 [Actinobacteria bacterium]|nr:MAG: hypothetical protein C4521_13180 [Actinomycetota bacterium]